MAGSTASRGSRLITRAKPAGWGEEPVEEGHDVQGSPCCRSIQLCPAVGAPPVGGVGARALLAKVLGG